MNRGSHSADPAALTTDEVIAWFNLARGPKPSPEICAEIAHRLDGPLSREQRQHLENMKNEPTYTENGREHWDVSAVSASLKLLADSLPTIKRHWDRILECEESISARSALVDLEISLNRSRYFIEYPFGEFKKSRAKKLKGWQIPSLLILRTVRFTLRKTSGSVGFSRNSPSVKITKLALERLGFGHVEHSTIASHAARWYKRFGDPMTANDGVADLLPNSDVGGS